MGKGWMAKIWQPRPTRIPEDRISSPRSTSRIFTGTPMTSCRSQRIFLACYGLLIIYGSLYPFSDWRYPDSETIAQMKVVWPAHVSRSDLLTNFLAYIPFGYLAVRALPSRIGAFGRFFLAVAAGSMLSATMEGTQLFLPARTSSANDLLMNSISTLVGALIAVGTVSTGMLGKKACELSLRWFFPGRLTDIGLGVLGVWACSQLAPFVPSLDMSTLKFGLKPLWHALHDSSLFKPYEAVVYALGIAGLGGVTQLMGRDRNRVFILFALFSFIVLVLKIFFVGRQLSLEAISGWGIAVFSLLGMRFLPQRFLRGVAAFAILAAFIVDELRPSGDLLAELHSFNLIPFRFHMAKLTGFITILEGVWPFAALAFIAISATKKSGSSFAFFAGLLLGVLVFFLEWCQQFIPGRYPDITQVILAAAGWTVPWLYQVRDNQVIQRGSEVQDV